MVVVIDKYGCELKPPLYNKTISGVKEDKVIIMP